MSWLLSPLTWLLLAAVLAALAWHRRSATLGIVCATIVVLAYAASTPLVANALLAGIEGESRGGDFRDATHCAATPLPETVVVLAGGVDRLPADAQDFGVMNIASRRRTERAVQWWRESGAGRMVITGGVVGPRKISNADLMRAYAIRLGVPANALRLEPRAKDTHENAVFVARLEPRVSRRIALSTSAVHMPRATTEFEAAGFEVACPLRSDFQAVAAALPYSLLPTSRALAKTEAGLHEAVGIAYHHLRAMLLPIRAEFRRWAAGDG